MEEAIRALELAPHARKTIGYRELDEDDAAFEAKKAAEIERLGVDPDRVFWWVRRIVEPDRIRSQQKIELGWHGSSVDWRSIERLRMEVTARRLNQCDPTDYELIDELRGDFVHDLAELTQLYYLRKQDD